MEFKERGRGDREQEILARVRRDVEKFISQKACKDLGTTIYAALGAHGITMRAYPEMRRSMYRELASDRTLQAKFLGKNKQIEKPMLKDNPEIMAGAIANEERQRAILGKDFE
ncbi:MAG: hypothetical protein ABH826_05535 [Patescibacteria group bacterium]|nr:hypothetical protein [Patescibacteria group bacterium]